jgi:membrane-associated phospholipid phosphatase
MEEVWRWGADLIIAIQTVHNPVLDAFFNLVTSLGSAEFYLVLIPLLYWCVDKYLAQRLAYLFLFSVYGSAALKHLFRHPRPFEYETRVLKLDLVPAGELGYGLPSTHSQGAITVWGYLAIQVRRRWLQGLALALIILIPFSRMYLGVHFPSDVAAGLVVGAMGLGLFLWLEPRLSPWLSGQSVLLQAGLAALVPGALLLLHSSRDATAAMGTLIGMGLGIVVESRTLRFSTAGPIWRRAARFVLGIVVLLLLREGLKLVLPLEGQPLYVLFRAVRYSLVGLWAALVAPLVFLRLGLASNDES